MEAMTQMPPGGGGEGAPPTGAQAPQASPSGSPASSPMQPKGQMEAGKVEVQQGVKILKGAINKFPYDSEEWQAVDKALQSLIKKFPPQASSDLGNAGMVKLLTQGGGGAQ